MNTLKKAALIAILVLPGCSGIPDGLTAVDGFEINRYLGTWYEIARLDHSFERGLTNVSALYEPRDDGGIRVVNRGFDKKAGEWKEAEGRAYFVAGHDIGRLKVSFFGPFYGGYNIIYLDKKDYAHALVCGPDRSYLWILSRERIMDDNILNKMVDEARRAGFETDRLIFAGHGERGAGWG